MLYTIHFERSPWLWTTLKFRHVSMQTEIAVVAPDLLLAVTLVCMVAQSFWAARALGSAYRSIVATLEAQECSVTVTDAQAPSSPGAQQQIEAMVKVCNATA